MAKAMPGKVVFQDDEIKVSVRKGSWSDAYILVKEGGQRIRVATQGTDHLYVVLWTGQMSPDSVDGCPAVRVEKVES